MGRNDDPPPQPVHGQLRLERAPARVGVDVDEARRRLEGSGLVVPAEPTTEQVRRLRIDQGLGIPEMADRLGLTATKVRYRLRVAGIGRVSKRAWRAGLAGLGEAADETFCTEVVRRYGDEGHSIRRIAADLRVDKRAVWRELERAGVPRRSPGRPKRPVTSAG